MSRVLEAISPQVKIAPTNAAAIAVPAPPGARGFYISVATNAAIVSLDGTVATASNGLLVPVGARADYVDTNKDLSVIGSAAGASDVYIVWVK